MYWISLYSLRCDDQRFLERFVVEKITNQSNIAYATSLSAQRITPVHLSLLKTNTFLLEKLQSLKGGRIPVTARNDSSHWAKESSFKVESSAASTVWNRRKADKKVSLGTRSETKERELKRLICLVESIGNLAKLRSGSSSTQRELERLNIFLENKIRSTLADEVSCESDGLRYNDEHEKTADESHTPEKNC